MLKITKQDAISIEYIGKTEGYDGHCLRAYSYFGSKMPDIVLAKETDTCYKVVKDDGTVEYVIENK